MSTNLTPPIAGLQLSMETVEVSSRKVGYADGTVPVSRVEVRAFFCSHQDWQSRLKEKWVERWE